VLLVDDDDAVSQVTARYLAMLGYTVVVAADAARALALAMQETRVDLVLSDIALPGMRGPALVRELRLRRPSLPTILMTGFAPETLSPEDLPHETGILTKPFTIEEIRVCLARKLGRETPSAPDGASASEKHTHASSCGDPASGRRQS